MKYLGAIVSDYDLVNKKYVDGREFRVTFSYDNDTYSSDLSDFDDLDNAIGDGKFVYGYYDGNVYSLTFIGGQLEMEAYFERYSAGSAAIDCFCVNELGQVIRIYEKPWVDYTDAAIGNAIAALY